MKVEFEMKDGTGVTFDTEGNNKLDDDLFAALMYVIEEATGNYEDIDNVTNVTIVM